MSDLIALLVCFQMVAQPAPVAVSGAAVATVTAPPAAKTLRLAQDTPVELMALNEVSTASALPGTMFKLRVNRPVEVDGVVVIPVGTMAYGRVESATDAGGLGKSGRMTAKLLNLRLGSVEIPLDGQMAAKGTGAGSAGVAFLFGGVLGLFHRGNNAKIKAGELVAGYIAADVDIDPLGQPPRVVSATAGAPSTTTTQP